MPIDSTMVDLALDRAIKSVTRLCAACPDVQAAQDVVAHLVDIR